MGTTNDPIYKQLSNGAKGDGAIMGVSSLDSIGFYGTAPVPQATAAPAGTGAGVAVVTTTPTTAAYGFTLAQAEQLIALVNYMRGVLVTLGFMPGT